MPIKKDLPNPCTKKKVRRKKRHWSSTGFRKNRFIELLERDGIYCRICDMEMFFGKEHENSDWCASIDHIQRRDQGGSDELSNLRLIHRVCNNFLDEIHRGK